VQATVLVVNESLMGNHQRELVDALATEGYVVGALPADIRDKILTFPIDRPLKPFPGNPAHAYSAHDASLLCSVLISPVLMCSAADSH
jgi:hypothetical protein